ncbi:peptidyl-tRNA hydrolase protein 1 [Mortierella sp. AM989]|nr:peptidyl-tRNA hydrolase protein 1 [Mortierella sp. AM989]
MATSTRHLLVVGLGNHTHPGTRHNIGMMVVDSIARRFNAPWTKMNHWQSEIATATTTIKVKKKTIFQPKEPIRASTQTATPATAGAATSAAGEKADTSTDPKTAAPVPVVRKKAPVEHNTIEVKLTLLKPLLLMNVSGSCVSRAAKDLGIKATDILVIHDDMERDIGKLSFKFEGSANGHNGIKSCIKSLGTQQFKRLRVGIGRPPNNDRSSNFIASYVLGRFKPLEVEKLEELVYDKAGDEIIKITTVSSTPPISQRHHKQ